MGAARELTPDIPDALLDKYFDLTKRALAKAKIVAPEKSHLEKVAMDFRTMAESYYTDAQHFRKGGDRARALGAVYYAHAWLDAGARLGVFDVGGDSDLFTLAG
ncbi:MAG: DUF357 domain-containing protein [Euryarchaeota archaeon]|nr:DUF357 domain-containing protein [Euryarchaeota archaeon]